MAVCSLCSLICLTRSEGSCISSLTSRSFVWPHWSLPREQELSVILVRTWEGQWEEQISWPFSPHTWHPFRRLTTLCFVLASFYSSWRLGESTQGVFLLSLRPKLCSSILFHKSFPLWAFPNTNKNQHFLSHLAADSLVNMLFGWELWRRKGINGKIWALNQPHPKPHPECILWLFMGFWKD